MAGKNAITTSNAMPVAISSADGRRPSSSAVISGSSAAARCGPASPSTRHPAGATMGFMAAPPRGPSSVMAVSIRCEAFQEVSMPSPLRSKLALAAVAALLLLGVAQRSLADDRRAITPDDVYSLRAVDDPQRSPDGAWVAYTVQHAVRDTDKSDTDVWMAR